MPDGAEFLTVARTLEGPQGAFAERPRRTAILLGCDISYKDEVIYAKGFGRRNVEEDLPVTSRTLFAIGSSSKAFTTFTLATLVERALRRGVAAGRRSRDKESTRRVAEAISALQSHTTSAPNTFAQYGALAALKADQAFVSDMRDEYNIRRMYMNKRFADISNVEVAEPTGAFYFLADIEKIGIKSLNFAEKLLSRSHVAVIPGICFGNDFTVRFSYACGLDVIKEGLDRFEDFCRSH